MRIREVKAAENILRETHTVSNEQFFKAGDGDKANHHILRTQRHLTGLRNAVTTNARVARRPRKAGREEILVEEVGDTTLVQGCLDEVHV